ncbi:MAG: carbohydrate ABC transporter permease [Clostridiales bacterium]|nr:carbohydrate ABC transporter permease [Clostridiales bacterium]
MTSWLTAAIAIIITVFALLVILDVVVITLKRKRAMPTNFLGRYFSKHLVQFNSFIVLTVFCIIWIVPLLIGVFGSLTSQYAFTNHPGELVPSDGFTFDNFEKLFTYKDTDGSRLPVERWILNSFIVSISSTLLYLIVAGFAAYAFVFLRFKFRNILFMFLIFTMVIPGVATLTPQLANIANLGIARSLWALILPGLGGVGGLYLIRQFMLGIPKDLIDSAKMDGMNNFKIMFRIVLPLAKSVFFVQGLFCFMGAWNDLLWPQIILGTGNKSLWTLQVGIAYISGDKTANAIGISLAGAIFSALPIIILYIFTQNKIIEGVATSGVKG